MNYKSELLEVWEGSLVLREEICLFVYVGVTPAYSCLRYTYSLIEKSRTASLNCVYFPNNVDSTSSTMFK